MAVNQIPPRGVEPLESNQQSAENKELTENTNPVFATGLAKIVQEYPELRALVKAWPELPEGTKGEIRDLIENHSMEGKDDGKQ